MSYSDKFANRKEHSILMVPKNNSKSRKIGSTLKNATLATLTKVANMHRRNKSSLINLAMDETLF